MKKILSVLHNKWLTLIYRIFLGGLFIFTGAVKMQDIKLLSVNAVYEYGILPIEPVDLAAVFGYALPFLELLAGIAILLGILTKLASLGGGLLGLSFSIGEAIVLMQGRNIDCGCFGGVIDTLVAQTFYLSVAIVILAILILTSPNAKFCSVDKKLGINW
jgi:uncharacterized membrane protein YphA (DoxX/SURF4 family)